MIMQSYDVDRRFAGVGRLYGEDRLEIFKKSHICIVGIGGVGSWVAESLARHGIGKITLIDMDHIAESNINRQIQALDSTLGSSKIDTMSIILKDIIPKISFDVVEYFLDENNYKMIDYLVINLINPNLMLFLPYYLLLEYYSLSQ